MRKFFEIIFCVCIWRTIYRAIYNMWMAVVRKLKFNRRTIRFQIYTLMIITISGTSLLEIVNFFINAAETGKFVESYWTAFLIVVGNCFLFHSVISLIMYKIANSVSEPIRLLVLLTQLLRKSISKSAMIRELATNENYKKIQQEERNDEIGELIKYFLTYIGLSAAQIERTANTSSSSAEFVQPKRIINVYYDPTQSYVLKQRKIGDSSPTSSFAGPSEEEHGLQKPDTMRSDYNASEYPEVRLELTSPLMRDSVMHSTSGRPVGNIKFHQRGYDPICVNWEKALENVEDDPNANKYVFNY